MVNFILNSMQKERPFPDWDFIFIVGISIAVGSLAIAGLLIALT